jgi:hypothetical protein
MGKKNVRHNAVKHAFYAHEMIIRPENKAEIEKLQRDLHAQMRPKTALQKLAFKQICYLAWRCELGARLDMRQVNALLFLPRSRNPHLTQFATPRWTPGTRPARKPYGEAFVFWTT